MYEMSELATTIIAPLIKIKLEDWRPLENPGEPMEMLRQWKKIVETETGSTLSSVTSQDPFGKLLWHAWVPIIRSAVK